MSLKCPVIQETLQRSAVFLRKIAENEENLGMGGEWRDLGGPFLLLGRDALKKSCLIFITGQADNAVQSWAA